MSDQEITAAPESGETETVVEPALQADQEDGGAASSSIGDLEPGMELSGEVKSVTDFGAFVDLGVGPQGLVHISQLARRRVEKVTDVVQIGQQVQVWVKKVDKQRGRISLTMVKPATVSLKDLKPEMVLKGTVTRIEPYGVFVDIGTGRDGMVHISQLADGYISAPADIVTVGDNIDVTVLNVDRKLRKVDLSTKAFFHVEQPEPTRHPVVVEEAPQASEEPVPTAMELAFQAAMQREETRTRPSLQKLVSGKARR
jgi:small subunit ribosomal protein S1